jgi:D-alanyl-D-alanine carboxypeptidase
MIAKPLRPFLVAVFFAVASFAGAVPGIAISPTDAASGPPPTCRYTDVLTQHRAYTQWNFTLLDTIYMIPKSYVPPSLVSTSNAGLNGGGKVRSFVIADLKDMARAARSAGAGLRVVSAYRSWSTQQSLYQRELNRYGENLAKHSVARPGHSEHQLGTTIDFGSAGSAGGVSQKFADSAAGHWMKQNSWKYGFVMSYPRNSTGKTCYYSEPWHFRFVGREMAANVHASGLTLREYIWRNYE